MFGLARGFFPERLAEDVAARFGPRIGVEELPIRSGFLRSFGRLRGERVRRLDDTFQSVQDVFVLEISRLMTLCKFCLSCLVMSRISSAWSTIL